MELLGQEQAILDVVAPHAEVRLDVGRIQDRLGALAGDGAAAAISIQQPGAKGALAFALDATRGDHGTLVRFERLEGLDEIRGRLLLIGADVGQEQVGLGRIPLGRTPDDVRPPSTVVAPRQPAILGPETCVSKDGAAQWRRFTVLGHEVDAAIPTDTLEKADLIGVAVLPTEEFPGLPEWQRAEVGKEAGSSLAVKHGDAVLVGIFSQQGGSGVSLFDPGYRLVAGEALQEPPYRTTGRRGL